MTVKKSWLKRAISILVLIEVFYLILINLALNLPVTQKLINQIRPAMFAVSWDSAWSWYPFRVHATGVSANGQTRNQQWQVDSPEASASIRLLPLIWKSVRLSSVDASDVVFHLRPRPRADKDYSKIRPYFAPIDNRPLETEPVAVPKKKKKKAWDISIDRMHASGIHHVWIYQLKVALTGELGADLHVRTRGGPFSLSNGRVDSHIDSIVLNGDREVVRNSYLNGIFSFAPFIAKENKGIKSLEFFSLDADIEAEVDSLAFLNLYLEAFQGLNVAGSGAVDGHVNYHLGKLMPGNDIRISADELAAQMLNYRVEGDGDINLMVTEAEQDALLFKIYFNALNGMHRSSGKIMITGKGLSILGKGRTRLLPIVDEQSFASTLTIDIPSIKVPDLALYQRFLPVKWSFMLLGGDGELQGRAELTRFGFSGFSRLRSKDANVAIRDFKFSSDLDINLNIDAPKMADTGIDVSGSYIHLDNARLSNRVTANKTPGKPWRMAVDIDKGRVKLILPEGTGKQANLKELLDGIKGKEILPMLDSDNEQLKLRGFISDLQWLNVLMKNKFNLVIKGSGEITADLVVESGWPAPGTQLNINPEKLKVEVLNYVATGSGDGHLKLAVEKGGDHPDIGLDIKMINASFSSKGDDQAFVENTDILLQVTGRNMSYNGPAKDIDLHLQIPSAQVRDMSVYNTYLPPGSPLQIIDGQASLTADVTLKPESASGSVKLVSSGLRGIIDNQSISADLNVDIKLAGGIPQNMDFDIAGSNLDISNVIVTGSKKDFKNDAWGIELVLKKARAIWKKPVKLDVEADFEMTDSRPFVAMMANKKGKEGWLGKAMTIDDIQGVVNLQMKQQTIIIPYAFATSEKIDVGAKGIIRQGSNNGMLYARYKKLHGLLKINNGKRNLDILKARKKFDEYVPNENMLKPE